MIPQVMAQNKGASAAPDVTGVTAKQDVEDHATAVKRPD